MYHLTPYHSMSHHIMYDLKGYGFEPPGGIFADNTPRRLLLQIKL